MQPSDALPYCIPTGTSNYSTKSSHSETVFASQKQGTLKSLLEQWQSVWKRGGMNKKLTRRGKWVVIGTSRPAFGWEINHKELIVHKPSIKLGASFLDIRKRFQ